MGEMREEGLVRAVHGGLAQVESVVSDACQSCGAKGACHSLGGERKRQVTAVNQAGAREGDLVQIAMPRAGALGAGALVYLGPVVALLAGGFAGDRLAPGWGWEAESGAVIGALAALAAAWIGLRWISARLARSKSLKVRVVRVLKKGATDAVDQCSVGV